MPLLASGALLGDQLRGFSFLLYRHVALLVTGSTAYDLLRYPFTELNLLRMS